MNTTVDSLAKIRQSLLDLSKRNPLLNYHKKKRSVQITVTALNKVFDQLVREGKPLPLLEIKQPIQRIINVSSDTLPEENLSRQLKPKLLQTPYSEAVLTQRCHQLAQQARLSIEETGCNVLYLAMGFLEWFQEAQGHQAPLILIPVKLEREASRYVISCYDENIETNLSLAEKLAQDFNLRLPTLVDQPAPETYLMQIAQAVEAMPNWQVTPQLRLDFFSFTKLLIYQDLDEKHWPANPHLQQILERKNRLPAYLKIDDEPLLPDASPATPLVLDADSTQQAVILEALWKNHNLVVIGPPGTGKSQTIANLIAAALAQGQKVLFVAEKQAALQVVKSRLEKIGLGEFCWLLPGHHSPKTELYAELKQRLEKTYPPPPKSPKFQEWSTQEQKLLAYSQLMNTQVGPYQEKIYEIFWKVERLRGEISGKGLFFENSLTGAEFARCIPKLQELISHYQGLPEEAGQVWQGFKPVNLLPGDEEVIQTHLTTLFLETQTYLTYLEVLCEETQLSIDYTIETFQTLAKVNSQLLANPPPSINPTIAIKLLDDTSLECLQRFQADKNEYLQWVTQAIKVLGRDIQSMQIVQQISRASKKLEELGFGNDSPNDLLYFIHAIDHLQEELQSLLSNPDSVSNFLTFLKLRELAYQAPHDLVLNKHPPHALKVTKFIFEQAHRTLAALAKLWQEQQNFFILSKLPNPDTLHRLAAELRKYRGRWLAFFEADYRQARRDIQRFLVSNKLISRPELPDRLDQVATLKHQIMQETQTESYSKSLGPLFAKVETDWERLAQHLDWAQHLSELLGSEEQALELLETQADPQSYLLRNTALIYEQWLRVEKAAKRLKVPLNSHFHIKTFVEKLLERRHSIHELVTILQQLPPVMDNPIISIQAATQSLLNAWRIRANLERNPHFNKLFGKYYQGIQTDTTAFINLADWLIPLKNSPLPKPLLRWLVSDDILTRLLIGQNLIQDTQIYLTRFNEFCQQLTQYGEFDKQSWLVSPCTLEHLLKTIQSCQTWVKILPAYATFYRLKQEADELGLAPITQALVSRQLPPEQVPLHFQYAVYQHLARELIRQNPKLATFTRSGYENLRQRFVELDTELLHLTRQQLAHQIAQRPIPQGNGSGKVATYSDRYLIAHEINKKRKHLPIRQLVKRAGPALLALKPCFMMSPLSVVQYLPPGEIEFDLLIFDEASQIRPEDALSAIVRSKKLVLVGDPKQLPPTTFFERVNEESELAESPLEGQESILDLCLTIYPKRHLRWHYRSAHESLIAFSNQYFYHNQLIVFPSVQARPPGICHHYVENATYFRGCNPQEAEAVAMAVLEHFRKFPHLSLGVATFNYDQQALIREKLDKLVQQDFQLETLVNGREEPFFIKNLENVQGDERDVIFVSTTYGPDPRTKRVYQRFGPIASEWGWRRLNVIFTRARQRLELFTSMRASEIHAEASHGVRILKAYLEYAETRKLPGSEGETVPLGSSDFEIAITRILQAYGYKTVPKVGVADFRIDLAVCHPEHPEEYILGIQYDGPHYHSTFSVRDRERLRPAILEAKGWTLHAIWSPDWFKNREAEITRLLHAIDLALVRRTFHYDAVSESMSHDIR